MNVEFAFIAESADAVNGLFYVVRGGTDIWYVPPQIQFPAPIGPMSFVVRMVGDPGETGRLLPVSFDVVDVDGRPTGVEGNSEISFQPHALDRTRTSSALMHFKVGFGAPSTGAFFFQMHSEGRRLCQVPFWILRAEASEPPV
ncbi:MAG: hypothetical protein ABR507_07585 [Actinomycetota bacterium]|nr:hypothetical protein [Actinomycetota bacterium]